MNNQELNQIYLMTESEKVSSDSYYLNRLTSLWGEECFDFNED